MILTVHWFWSCPYKKSGLLKKQTLFCHFHVFWWSISDVSDRSENPMNRKRTIFCIESKEAIGRGTRWWGDNRTGQSHTLFFVILKNVKSFHKHIENYYSIQMKIPRKPAHMRVPEGTLKLLWAFVIFYFCWFPWYFHFIIYYWKNINWYSQFTDFDHVLTRNLDC